MAFEEVLTTVTVDAGADLSSSQFFFVKLDSNGDIVACDTAGEQAYGVLQDDPESGEAGTVAIAGVSKVEAGGSVSVGDNISTDASGNAVTSSTGDVILGIARSAAASGEVVSVDFRSSLGTA